MNDDNNNNNNNSNAKAGRTQRVPYYDEAFHNRPGAMRVGGGGLNDSIRSDLPTEVSSSRSLLPAAQAASSKQDLIEIMHAELVDEETERNREEEVIQEFLRQQVVVTAEPIVVSSSSCEQQQQQQRPVVQPDTFPEEHDEELINNNDEDLESNIDEKAEGTKNHTAEGSFCWNKPKPKWVWIAGGGGAATVVVLLIVVIISVTVGRGGDDKEKVLTVTTLSPSFVEPTPVPMTLDLDDSSSFQPSTTPAAATAVTSSAMPSSSSSRTLAPSSPSSSTPTDPCAQLTETYQTCLRDTLVMDSQVDECVQCTNDLIKTTPRSDCSLFRKVFCWNFKEDCSASCSWCSDEILDWVQCGVLSDQCVLNCPDNPAPAAPVTSAPNNDDGATPPLPSPPTIGLPSPTTL